MLRFRIISTFSDLLQGHRVFWTILFQLSVGICPRICKSSLSFLDIQNRSKSAKKPDSTLWFFTLKTLKMLILEQNMWKTPFCMKSSFLVWNVFKPVFREKNTTFWKHVISTLHLCWCYLIVFWMQHIFENTSLMRMIFTCWMMQFWNKLWCTVVINFFNNHFAIQRHFLPKNDDILQKRLLQKYCSKMSIWVW